MKKLCFLSLLCLFTALSACSSFEKFDAADNVQDESDDTGGLGSFSGSVGTFNMSSVVSASFNENEDKTLWILLADGEVCCSCGSDGTQDVDASMILLNTVPNAEGSYDESTDSLGMEMFLLTTTAGNTSTIVDNTTDVSITIESTSDIQVTGSYSGTFSSGDAISGTFSAEFCDEGN